MRACAALDARRGPGGDGGVAYIAFPLRRQNACGAGPPPHPKINTAKITPAPQHLGAHRSPYRSARTTTTRIANGAHAATALAVVTGFPRRNIHAAKSTMFQSARPA
jgi:hypothetical protein